MEAITQASRCHYCGEHIESGELCDPCHNYLMAEAYQPSQEPCPSCGGAGTWETECCNGSGGCSCRGGMVDMGRCNVCGGGGYVIEHHYNPRANSDFILSAGACFAGSGPTSGYWAGKSALGMPSKNL